MPAYKRPLAPYVLRSRQGDNFPKTTAPVFNWVPGSPYSVPAFKTPLLTTDRENTVLVFPGWFNPSHRAHFELLRYVMQECGPRLNIIAAIVVIGGSDRVTESFRPLLELPQRRRLWTGEWDYATSAPGADETGHKGNPYLPSWLWMYDGHSWTTGFTDFRSRLTDAVEADGFKIKFVKLHGPRYLAGMNEMPSITRWAGCNNLLVCDHFDAGSPPRINGCSDWTDAVITATDANIEDYNRDNGDVLLTQPRDTPETEQLLAASEDGNPLAADRPAPIKMCHVRAHGESTVMFLPMTKIKRRLEAYRQRVPGTELNPDLSTSRLVRQAMLDYLDEREFLELLAHAEASGHGSEPQSGTNPSPAADSTSNRNVNAADLALRCCNAKERFTADLRDVLLFPETYVAIIEDGDQDDFPYYTGGFIGSLFETRDGLWALVLVEAKGDGHGDTREWQLIKIEDKGDGEGPNKFDVGTRLKLGGLNVEGQRENKRGASVEVKAEDEDEGDGDDDGENGAGDEDADAESKSESHLDGSEFDLGDLRCKYYSAEAFLDGLGE